MAYYRVVHDTRYRYTMPVSRAHHVLHLRPRDCSWQQLDSAELVVQPTPVECTDGIDAFGNPQTTLAFEAPHDSLQVSSRLSLRVTARPWADRAAQGPAWEVAAAALDPVGGGRHDAGRFRYASPHVPAHAALADYARPSFPPGRALLAATADLVARIHRDFGYDPAATEVDTPLLTVLAQRRGVCQDFAHLATGCLRAMGLAARYVSGYLCTEPPPGEPRLAGADASHAWFAVWCPEHGWVEFDPTNNCEVDERFVLVAWGRDFGDVSPLRGIIRGGGEHTLEVAVTVQPQH